VHAEHSGRARGAFINVVDSQRAAVAIGNVGVVRRIREAWKIREAFVWGAEDFHGFEPTRVVTPAGIAESSRDLSNPLAASLGLDGL
jgi:hypothetical protein